MEVKKLPTLPTLPKKKQVAAYARVSSGKDAMLHSLSAQVSYYSAYIQKHPEWLYCGVYVDEAVTGTKSERPEFQRLLSDCRAGKIDMVITKSISRFARNTVTLLETVRELKTLGIDVFFEEHNIHTMSAAGEMMLTLLASVAQEESRMTSERMKWRVRKNFEEGVPWNGTVYGYRLYADKFFIEPREAEIVRYIFDRFLQGVGVNALANELNAFGVPSRFGMTWCKNSVMNVLRNYMYTGNLLLQKTYRTDHITKHKAVNSGQLPMYYVEGAHEPIIDIETFERTQAEIRRRAALFTPPKPAEPQYPFTGIITCAVCGKKFRRKKRKNDAVWICDNKNMHGKSACGSKQIPEAVLAGLAESCLPKTIASIVAGNGNNVRLVFSDGTELHTVWKDRSRSESWTDEMKQKAREKTYGRYHQNTGDKEQIHIGSGVADA